MRELPLVEEEAMVVILVVVTVTEVEVVAVVVAVAIILATFAMVAVAVAVAMLQPVAMPLRLVALYHLHVVIFRMRPASAIVHARMCLPRSV
jgi:hypothetical protein